MRTSYEEGRKYYLSFHPPDYVSCLLKQNYKGLRHIPSSQGHGIPQDVWIASK